jgi:hypothetical protein
MIFKVLMFNAFESGRLLQFLLNGRQLQNNLMEDNQKYL